MKPRPRMRSVLIFLSLVPSGLALSASVQLQEGNMTVVPEGFLATRERSVVVEAISARKLFRTNLDQERFENYLQTSGPDYVLRITTSGMIKELVDRLQSLQMKESLSSELIDLRYRISFDDGEKNLGRVYVGAFGEILTQGKVFQPDVKGKWLREVWTILQSDIIK